MKSKSSRLSSLQCLETPAVVWEMDGLQQAHKKDLGVIFGLNGFTFAWGWGGMDWIVLTWFLTLLIYLTNALLFSLHHLHLASPFPIWSISLAQEMWCGYISHLYYRIKAALLLLPFGEERRGGQALHKEVRSAGDLSFSGVVCFFWRKMDLGWETKTQNTYWIIFYRWQSCSDKGKEKLLAGKMQVTWKHWL